MSSSDEAVRAAACQGFTIRERPDHQPLGPCLHCGKTYQQHRATDPVNSSDEAIEAAAKAIGCYSDEQWQRWQHTSQGQQAHDRALVAVRAAYPLIAAAVRAEAVADEQQIRAQAIDDFSTHEWAVVARAERTIAVEKAQREAVQQVRHDMELLADRVEDYTQEGVRIRLRNYAAQLEHSLAAGSVPVATPPAEPATTVHDANCEQQLGACCCHCQKRADVAFSHAAPPQPVTCEACAKIGCSHSGIDGETGLCWCCGWAPGPVSVPKESSE